MGANPLPLDILTMQDDVVGALTNRDELQNIPVTSWRKLTIAKEVDLRTMIYKGRSGRTGAGILVELPVIKVPRPNLPGPEGELLLPVTVMEVPAINQVPPTGTLQSAEELAQWVLDTLHGFRPRGGKGFTMRVEENAVVPNNSLARIYSDVGLLAYTCNIGMRMTRPQILACDRPSYQLAAGTVTLTNGANTPNATIWYTQDGTWPGQFPTKGSASTQYSGPFAVASGDVVRWAAYQNGYKFSETGYEIVP